MFKNITVIFFLLCFTSLTYAQEIEGKKEEAQFSALLVNAQYGFQNPIGQLSDRFGRNNIVGLGVDYLPARSNFLFGLDGYYLFGTDVRTDVLSQIRRDEDDAIIGQNQTVATVLLRSRGIFMGGHLGFLFPILKNNPRSGIRVTAGAGFIQYKIRIQDDSESVPQIAGEYVKGYDHLTNGVSFSQFIGYHHLAINKMINFYAGFDINEAIVKNRRDINFNTMMKDEESKFDVRIGFKVGWTLPFYFNRPTEEVYY